MNGTNKKLYAALAAAGTCTAVAAALSYSVTKAFLSAALDRDPPKVIGLLKLGLSKTSFAKELEKAKKEAVKRIDRSRYEEVAITAFDGVRLVGHYRKAENAVRTVICFHGWRSNWYEDYGIVSGFLESNGCSVLYVEQRGQNASGGDSMGFALLERYDCVSWVNYVVSLGDGLPIYLSGISLGAATVMMAAGLGLPDQVHGISADCGFTSPEAIWKYSAEKYLHLPYTNFRKQTVRALCRRKLDSEDCSYSATQALAAAKVPVLFIHGTADCLVPIEMTYQNYLACASPKRLLIVPGADHGMSYIVDRERYEKTVKELWKDFD